MASTRSRICLSVLLALLASCALPSAAAAEWSLPATTLSDPGEGGQSPAIATGPDGTTTAVWRQYGFFSSIQVSTRSPDGSTFSTPATLGTLPNAGEPKVSIGPDGTTTVIWLQQTYDGLSLWQATRPSGSKTFSIHSQLSDAAPQHPALAVGPDGSAVAAWTDLVSIGPSDVRLLYVSVRPSASAPFGAPQVLGAPANDGVEIPVVSMGQDGRATVVWTGPGEEEPYSVLWTSTYSPETGYFSVPKRLSDVGHRTEMANVVTAPNGETTVTWIDRESEFGLARLVAATRPPNSNVFGPLELLSPDIYPISPSPSYLTVGPDGAASAVWNDGSIQVATRPAGETTFSTPVTIASGDGLADRGPSVDTGASGDTIVTWQQGGATNNGVFASTRRRGDETFSAPVELGVAGLNEVPELALASAGPCKGLNTAIWRHWDGSIWSIQQSSEPATTCEPDLGPLVVDGPAKVRKGKRATFEVEISNAGSGKAQDLVVRASGKGVSAAPKSAGDLGVGRFKTVPIAVKFTSSGKVKLTLEVQSRNAGGIRKSVWVKVLG